MSRGMGATAEQAASADVIRFALFFQAAFATGTLYAWTGSGDRQWNGQTWTGAGNLIGVSGLEETDDGRAVGITATFTATTALVSAALGAARQGLPGIVWLALFDAAGNFIPGTPLQMWAGSLDVPTVTRAGDVATLSITYESPLADADRPREFRWTDQQQRSDYPADGSFRYVAQLADKAIGVGVAQ